MSCGPQILTRKPQPQDLAVNVDAFGDRDFKETSEVPRVALAHVIMSSSGGEDADTQRDDHGRHGMSHTPLRTEARGGTHGL